MSYQVISKYPEIQALYEASRRAGSSHKFAEMCAFQEAPYTQTQTRVAARLKQTGFSDTPRGKVVENFYKQKAAAAGVDIGNKILMHQLERFPGDPEAWVSPSTPMDDVARICRERGWGAKGSGLDIKAVKDVEPAQEGQYRPDPALVQEEVAKLKREHKDMTPAEESQASAELSKKMAGVWGE